MACCTKITKKKRKTIIPDNESSVSSYTEGRDGYVLVKYLGTLAVKVVGCKTKHKYIFEQNAMRLIDAGDADCLFDLMSGSFEVFIEEIENASAESVDSEVERKSRELAETYS